MPLMRCLIGFGAIVVLASLTGCATGVVQQPLRIERPDGEQRVWPAPPAVPRYRFLGMLTGEANYQYGDGAQRSTGATVFRWIVGLGQSREAPMRLVRPQSGMVDDRGRILVTDVGRAAVMMFPRESSEPDPWGVALPDGTPFKSPIGIAAAADGGYWVADSALGLVARLDADGEPMAPLGTDSLKRPNGLARDPESGDLFVADSEADNIKRFSRRGELVSVLGGPGREPGRFNGPTHISFRDGELYVTDTLNARIQVLEPDGTVVRTVGQRGVYLGNFTRPKGVAVDSEGHIYAVESYYDHLLVYSNKGRFLMGIGGSGTSVGRFISPAGVWTDQRDRVFIADLMNGRVMVLQFLGD